MTLEPCEDCGTKNDPRWYLDGVCRDCLNIDPNKQGRRGYVSPGQAMRNSEALDHAEAENRARVVNNASNQ